MRLNPDCIRDILLVIEEQVAPHTFCSFNPEFAEERLPQYSYDEIIYHLEQCEMMGYFKKVIKDLSMNYTVTDLTPSAHAFLANIRTNTNWNKTKQIAKKVGSFSLNTLTSIASSVVSDLISKQF